MKKIQKLLILLLLVGCNSPRQEEQATLEKRQYIKERNKVEVITLQLSSFKQELVSIGKLEALCKSALRFKLSGELENVYIKNGEHVKAGTKIAILNRFKQRQRLEEVKLSVEKAQLDLMDVLIGQGYNPNDTTNIPKNMMDVAKSRSGYTSALNNLKLAEYDLEATVLTAPFTGTIANLKTKVFENTPGDAFCLLIDDSGFEVVFSVLEAELSQIKIGQKVSVFPFSSKIEVGGKINEINPVIDKNGLIAVKAFVSNPGSLMEGMNVKVLISNEISNQLVVPKSAVLQRDNQEVLFRYTNGTAWWTYVQTLHENSTSYSVIAHPDKGATLQAGDTIIVSGNLNLAHLSEVEI